MSETASYNEVLCGISNDGVAPRHAGFVPNAARRADTLMNDATLAITDIFSLIREDLELAGHIFDDALQSDLPFVNDLSATVRAYRGKMLRPGLLLLSARSSGRVTQVHSTLAAVVEMVHMATLVHDDVLDEAEERRRGPTVRMLEGNKGAVLLGDFFISHAFHLCASIGDTHASTRIGQTTNCVCEGEMLQNRHCQDAGLSLEDYLEIIRRKTAVLTAVCCELGAHYAGAANCVVESLSRFGLSLGMAFQIVDDVLDITGEQQTVGKTLGTDMQGGKATLPLIHCRDHAEGAVHHRIVDALSGETSLHGAALIELLNSTGSLDWSLATARSYIDGAMAELEALPPGEGREALEALAELTLRRRF